MSVGKQVAIRDATRDDYPRWVPLWDGYNAFYGRAGETALAPEITQMTWARFFDAYEPMHAMVAEDAGKLLGLVHFLYHRSTTQIAPTCYMQDLFTVEEARGKGEVSRDWRGRIVCGQKQGRHATRPGTTIPGGFHFGISCLPMAEPERPRWRPRSRK